MSISECQWSDEGTSNSESCGNDGGRSGSTHLPLERLWRVTVGSVLDLTIHVIIVISEGVLVSVLGVAAGLVIVFLDGLESEGDVFEEEVSWGFVVEESGTLDGRSFQNIDTAAWFDYIFCFGLFDLDANCVVVSNHAVIKVLLQKVATKEIFRRWRLPLPSFFASPFKNFRMLVGDDDILDRIIFVFALWKLWFWLLISNRIRGEVFVFISVVSCWGWKVCKSHFEGHLNDALFFHYLCFDFFDVPEWNSFILRESFRFLCFFIYL